MKRSKNVLLAVLCILVTNSIGFTQEDQLQEVASQIEAETENLNSLQGDRKSLESQVKTLETKRSRTNKALALKREELQGLEDRSKETQENLKKIEEQHAALLSRFKAAVQAVLFQSQESMELKSLLSKDSISLTELKYYTGAAQRSYQHISMDLISNTQKLNSLTEDLNSLKDEKSEVVQGLQTALEEQTKVIAESKEKFAALQDKITLVKRSLNSLKAQRLRLATALRGLGGVSSDEPQKRVGALGNDTSESPSTLSNSADLLLPTTGRVLRRFSVSGPYLRTGVAPSSKGTEISGEPDSPVVASAPGTIVFAGKLPGYDQVVILDHGGRVYSLYGALGQLMTERGRSVQKGAQIGTVSERKAIYFEVREKRDSVDPRKFFGSEKGF